MKLYFVTGNEDKLREAKNILSDFTIIHQPLDLDEVQSIDPKYVIEKKLEAAKESLKGKALFVEDVSFSLSCGLPGPFIKYFEKLLGGKGIYELSKVWGDAATARCDLGCFIPGEDPLFVSGEVTGRVVEPCGNNGFGFDSIFIQDGMEQRWSEVHMEVKNQDSHRARALHALAKELERRT